MDDSGIGTIPLHSLHALNAVPPSAVHYREQKEHRETQGIYLKDSQQLHAVVVEVLQL